MAVGFTFLPAAAALHSEVDMAHFAKLDENNTVTAVFVVHNNELAINSEVIIENGFIKEKLVLSEERGIQFLQGLYGADTCWAQTSYNGNFRGKYASIGDTYDADANEFRSPVVAPSVDAPVIEPVVEVEPQMVIETQAPVVLESADIPALTTADIQALTSQQISGLE